MNYEPNTRRGTIEYAVTVSRIDVLWCIGLRIFYVIENLL